jgi:hypothetical protein
MVDQAATFDGMAISQGLLQGIKHKARVGRGAYSPADDPPRVSVDDEGNVDEPLPGRDVGEVRQP